MTTPDEFDVFLSQLRPAPAPDAVIAHAQAAAKAMQNAQQAALSQNRRPVVRPQPGAPYGLPRPTPSGQLGVHGAVPHARSTLPGTIPPIGTPHVAAGLFVLGQSVDGPQNLRISPMISIPARVLASSSPVDAIRAWQIESRASTSETNPNFAQDQFMALMPMQSAPLFSSVGASVESAPLVFFDVDPNDPRVEKDAGCGNYRGSYEWYGIQRNPVYDANGKPKLDDAGFPEYEEVEYLNVVVIFDSCLWYLIYLVKSRKVEGGKDVVEIEDDPIFKKKIKGPKTDSGGARWWPLEFPEKPKIRKGGTEGGATRGGGGWVIELPVEGTYYTIQLIRVCEVLYECKNAAKTTPPTDEEALEALKKECANKAFRPDGFKLYPIHDQTDAKTGEKKVPGGQISVDWPSDPDIEKLGAALGYMAKFTFREFWIYVFKYPGELIKVIYTSSFSVRRWTCNPDGTSTHDPKGDKDQFGEPKELVGKDLKDDSGDIKKDLKDKLKDSAGVDLDDKTKNPLEQASGKTIK